METQSTILIVDDNRTNVAIMEEILENYQVISATGGEEALKQARDLRPDLILLDIMMPGIDGYEVCTQLRKDERSKDIPIIFLTAKTEKEDIDKAFGIGGQDYIAKPFDANDLMEKVKKYLK